MVHDDEDLLAPKEAAGELKVSRDSVVRLIRRGELSAVEFPKMGGTGKNVKRMVKRGEIRRFKERRATVKKLYDFFEE